MSIEPSNRVALSGPTMGTRWSAVFFSADPDPRLQVALRAAVDAVDATMSTWKADSDLMRLNRMPRGIWLEVAPQLCAVVALGLQIGQASRGAFDIGVGAAVEAWGFGASDPQSDNLPIARAVSPLTTANAVEVDLPGSRLRRHGDVSIDLSGIAKGHGVDCLAEVLIAQGIADFIVSIDGEVRGCGTKPDGSGWLVGLERPDREHRQLARTLAVSDVAIATSGDYRHFRTVGGKIVSHTIDPRTGAPLDGHVCAVTVTAEHCAVADAWATALMVLGEHEGPVLAEQLGLDALFTLRRNGILHEIGIGAFAQAPNDQHREN
ncbi:FAD:protein FMN transferase [Devosia sp.]|uniref:FAD:protein FMN transferase n=1 Tax=Devosia sp. TaxID=1871048 RepID=UPI0032631402